jgi:hypothetical protein
MTTFTSADLPHRLVLKFCSAQADHGHCSCREGTECRIAQLREDETAGRRRPSAPKTALPIDSEARKNIPLCTGLLDYFPAALAAVAHVSKVGNDKHNPGEPLHHARGKSMDHADCIMRHHVERGTIDPVSGLRHSAFLAWRALAQLQEELEREEGAPLPRGARAAEVKRADGVTVYHPPF